MPFRKLCYTWEKFYFSGFCFLVVNGSLLMCYSLCLRIKMNIFRSQPNQNLFIFRRKDTDFMKFCFLLLEKERERERIKTKNDYPCNHRSSSIVVDSKWYGFSMLHMLLTFKIEFFFSFWLRKQNFTSCSINNDFEDTDK